MDCASILNKLYSVLMTYNIDVDDYARIIEIFQDEECDNYAESEMYGVALNDDLFILNEFNKNNTSNISSFDDFSTEIKNIFNDIDFFDDELINLYLKWKESAI